VPVDVAVARMGRIRTYVEERAKTRLPVVYRITMPLDGRILPIDLKERDAVTAGKVVARLEAADFDTAVAEGAARLQRLQNMIVENQDNRLENNAIRGFDEFLKSMAAAVESARLQTTSSDNASNMPSASSSGRRACSKRRRFPNRSGTKGSCSPSKARSIFRRTC
jgi:multidrug efflux pump subunit AcrA (membrane-fusion protein)